MNQKPQGKFSDKQRASYLREIGDRDKRILSELSAEQGSLLIANFAMTGIEITDASELNQRLAMWRTIFEKRL